MRTSWTPVAGLALVALIAAGCGESRRERLGEDRTDRDRYPAAAPRSDTTVPPASPGATTPPGGAVTPMPGSTSPSGSTSGSSTGSR